MQIGMMGLGRMGANMVRRLIKGGHECVVYDTNSAAVEALVAEGAIGATSTGDLIAKLEGPRTIWLMLPAAITGKIALDLAASLSPGDCIIDGGNSFYQDAIDLSAKLSPMGIDLIDAGTSGGVWGLARGYCLMIGGNDAAVERLTPIFRTLSPDGAEPDAPLDKAAGTATEGWLHCGPTGAGHFVKMVHNGIEYGMMAAYAEGLNILHAANAGKADHAADAETAPLAQPHYYQYDFDLPAIAEVWRHSSVISSWLLDLTAQALAVDPTLSDFGGRVSDSGEGRWTLKAAIDTGVPAPVLSSALFDRFSSQGKALYADKMLSAMRHAFGGHLEKKGVKR